MSIRFKLAVPTLVGLAVIILLIQFFWKPIQLENAKREYEKNISDLLVIGETGIIQDLLEGDLGALFSTMDQLVESHEDSWSNVTLYDERKKRLYPLIKNSETTIQNGNLIHIVYPLSISGTKLGSLELDADWGNKKITVINNLNNIRDMIIWLFILALLLTAISLYYVIYKPLDKLGKAANKIGHGNFNVELPASTKDEMGELTNSFSAMLIELRFQNYALDHHAIVSSADETGVITHVNNKFLDISGYTFEELLGKTHRVIKSNAHTPDFYEQMWATLLRGDVWHGEICNTMKTGEHYWVSSTIVPFLDDQGEPKRYMSVQTDITERKNAEKRLIHMANHDALTGLPTHRLCVERLSMALSLARRDQKMVAVMYIDLDGFKEVNDTLGHAAGDLLLVSISERLVKSVREMDTVARVGGDEFIIILSRIHVRENASLVAQKIIDTFVTPFTLDGNTVSIGASIGIALYPDHEQEPEALIKRADETMYAVKRKCKNNFAFSDDVL